MPYKSEAQRKFMNAAANRGEIKQSTVDEYNKASKGMKLPQKASDGGEVKTKEQKDKDHYKKLKQMMGVK